MKRALLCLILGASIVSVSSCDFFRKIAGRETSEEIAAKQAQIEIQRLAQIKEQKKLDAIKAAKEKAEQDSIAVMQEILAQGKKVLRPMDKGKLNQAPLPFRYYVTIGSFEEPQNAKRIAAKAQEAGFQTEFVTVCGVLTGVFLNPTNSLIEAYHTLQSVKGQDFCPKDAWILDTK